MERSEIVAIIEEAERAVAAKEPIGPTGFWGAVAAIKGSRELVDEFAGRVATVDTAAFRQWAWIVVPLAVGNAVALLGTAAGLGLVWWAYFLTGLEGAVVFLLGFGVLLVTTHGLAHLSVGTIVGIGFTNWFVAGLSTPQPGVKTDYATYLHAPPRSRAWMHASGALTTKILPFSLIGAAVAADIPGWVVWVLVAVGVGTIITDFLWSTTASDWKKYRREMRLARGQ